MYCVAPYEADSQIAFMVASGLADFAITDDSDLLAYCCPDTVFKLNLRGECQTAHLTNILTSLSMSKDEFIDLCILSGCDYCKLAGVGINKAKTIVNAAFKKGEDCLHYVESMYPEKVNTEYKKRFLVARDCFTHAIVFDVCSLKVSRLDTPDSYHTCFHEVGMYLLRMNLTVYNTLHTDALIKLQ
jgi:exonuclease-1